jgi:hypothetical protein
MLPKEVDDAIHVLQLGDVAVQVHPVDTLDLQGDMVLQNVRHTAC